MGSPRLGSSLNVPSAREPLATRMHPTWRAWNKSFVRVGTKFQSSSWHSPPRADTWVCKLHVHIMLLNMFLPRFRPSSFITGANINFKLVIGIIFGRHPISIFILLPTELQTEQQDVFSSSCHQQYQFSMPQYTKMTQYNIYSISIPILT